MESIVNQSYENIELIIFDDASKDISQKIIEHWLPALKKRFIRVIYIPREKNVGVVRNCNEGLELAKGKYICLFASDDLMLPMKIEQNVKFLEDNPKYGMVYSNIFYLKRGKISKKPIFSEEMPNGDIFLDLLTKKNYIPALSVCVRKNVFNCVGKYNENLNAEDYQMWLKISEKYEVGYIHKPLAIYRFNTNSLSFSREYKIDSMEDWLYCKKSFSASEKVNKEIMLDVLKTTYANFAQRSFYFNDIKKFKEYHKNYIKLNNKVNSSSIKLKLCSYFVKVPFLYKTIVALVEMYRYSKLTTIETLGKNIKNALKK